MHFAHQSGIYQVGVNLVILTCWDATSFKLLVALYRQIAQIYVFKHDCLFFFANVCNVCFRLCSRDPHQLFQRLESQVRVFVIEHKVFLRNKINAGFASQPESRVIMARFLEQYDNLSKVARIVSENLSTLVCDNISSLSDFWMKWMVFSVIIILIM